MGKVSKAKTPEPMTLASNPPSVVDERKSTHGTTASPLQISR